MRHTKRNRWTLAAVLAGLVLQVTPAPAQRNVSPEVLLQSAIQKETVDGDLKAAIELYKEVVTKAGGNHAVAAKALVQMGQCYEKLGNAEAQKAYERVLRDYADQRELAMEARTRLSAMSHAAGSASASAMTARRVWAGPEVDGDGAPSPDGRYLSYTDWSTGGLAVRDLSTGETRRLTNKGSRLDSSDYAYFSTFSPDGRQVAYAWCCTKNNSAEGGLGEQAWDLRLISVNGGLDGAKPRILYSNEDVAYLQPTGWSSDGKYILATVERRDTTTQLVLISAADGSVRVLKTLGWRWPSGRFSPDGRYIAYDFPTKEDSPERDIFVLATDGSRETTLVEHPGNDFVLGWGSDGKRILFASDRTGSLGAWAIAVAEGRPQGPAELAKGDIGGISPMGVTRSGAFYYSLQAGIQDIYIASLDMATGKVVAPPTPVSQRLLGANSSAAWSPDGQHLAYLSRRDNSSRDYGPRVLHIRSLKTGEERELSPNLSGFFTLCRLRWSPDGRSLLASATDNKGRSGLYQIDVQTGAVSPTVQGTERFAEGVWSQDGKAIFYANSIFGDTPVIRVRDLETGRDSAFYRPALPSQVRSLALSPDGRRLALSISRTEASALLVIPTAGGDPRELLKTPAGEDMITAVEWTRDGRQLLFSRKNELWRIPADGGEAQKLGLGLASNSRGASVSVHPDGQRIAFSAGEQKLEVWVMENLLPVAKARR